MNEYVPVRPEDLTDEKLVAGEVRALRTEMRDWFGLLISRSDRYDARISALELHRSDVNDRLDRHNHRLAALEAAVIRKP